MNELHRATYPDPRRHIPKMLTLASVVPDEMVSDLGSGDGRIVIAAAKDFARVVGVEVRRRLVREARKGEEDGTVPSNRDNVSPTSRR